MAEILSCLWAYRWRAATWASTFPRFTKPPIHTEFIPNALQWQQQIGTAHLTPLLPGRFQQDKPIPLHILGFQKSHASFHSSAEKVTWKTALPAFRVGRTLLTAGCAWKHEQTFKYVVSRITGGERSSGSSAKLWNVLGKSLKRY